MEIKIDTRILKVFFEEPNKTFLIREIARKTGINHTTVGQYLKHLVENNILKKEKGEPYSGYKIILSKEYLNFKTHYNLEKLRKSKLIEDLEEFYDFPVIVVFGSYAKAIDDEKSDIDICVITDIDKEFDGGKYERGLNRKLSLHVFDNKRWSAMKEKNKELINSVCNGIVLSGELEVFP